MVFLPVRSKEVPDFDGHFVLKLASRVSSIYFHKPLVQKIRFFFDELGMIVIELFNQVVDITHHISEEKHANKLKRAVTVTADSLAKFTSTAIL